MRVLIKNCNWICIRRSQLVLLGGPYYNEFRLEQSRAEWYRALDLLAVLWWHSLTDAPAWQSSVPLKILGEKIHITVCYLGHLQLFFFFCAASAHAIPKLVFSHACIFSEQIQHTKKCMCSLA